MLKVFSYFIAAAIAISCIPAFTQSAVRSPVVQGTFGDLPAKNTDDLAKTAQLEARAAEIRTAFVHRYGTHEEIEAFDNAQEFAENSKHGRSQNPSDLTSTEIFDRVFHRVQYNKDFEGITRVQAANGGTRSKASAISRMATEEMGRFVPYLGMAGGTESQARAQRELALSQQQASEAQDLEFAALAEKALAPFLTKEEQIEYRDGDYKARARLFFKAGLTVLAVAGSPNPFILMVNDPSGITGPGGVSFNYPGGAGSFHEFYPLEVPATMLSGPGRWRISRPERWELTARLQKRFMQDGYDAFSGTQASSFLVRLNDPGGSYHGKLVGFFGPTADKQYQLAGEEEKRAMNKTALVMTLAATVILGTRAGL